MKSLKVLGVALICGLMLSGAAVCAAPQRIVSLNFCTDQLLLTLAPRERIAALTYLATRPELSVQWRQAQGIPQVRGSAEEVLALQPDLVLASVYTKRYTVKLLKQFGVPVVIIQPAKSFADVREHIQQIAELIGVPQHGAEMVASLETDLAQLARTVSRSGAFYRQGGYTSGSETLSDSVMQAANMANVAVAAGVQGSSFLPLERLVVEQPDWLITSDYKRGIPTLGNRLFRHPVLHDMPGGEFILPGNLTLCGGGWNIRAVRLLAALPPTQ